jgi:sodium/bile acid cotransporter 7
MVSHLAKRWFLLVLGASIALALARPGWVRPLVGPLPPHAVVAASLFLVAVGLEGRRLYQAVLRPGPALWALAISYGALPTLGWLTGFLLPLPDLRVGLLIIASVPCTLASAVIWTRLAGGNEATALLAVLLSTGTSWLATTVWLTLATGAHVAADQGGMMASLFLVLIVPVALGQLVRLVPGVPRTVTRLRPVLGGVARLLVLSIILKAVVDVADRTSELTAGAVTATGAACIGTHLAALFAGLWTSRALGFVRPDCVAVAFACSQKTLPVALVLFEDYFKAEYPLAVVALVFYHVGQLVVDTFIADALARRTEDKGRGSGKDSSPPPHPEDLDESC